MDGRGDELRAARSAFDGAFKEKLRVHDPGLRREVEAVEPEAFFEDAGLERGGRAQLRPVGAS